MVITFPMMMYAIIALLFAILLACIFGFQRIYLKLDRQEYKTTVAKHMWEYETSRHPASAMKLQTPPERDE